MRDLERVGRTVGTAYAWNSIGAVVGTVAGGALFLPWFGIQGTAGAAANDMAATGSDNNSLRFNIELLPGIVRMT